MTSPPRALGVMAKVPLPGAVKTRLIPPLTGEQAAMLYAAFLRDAIMTGLSVRDCSVTVIHPPADIVAPLRDVLPDGVALTRQAGEGLGAGLRDAFLQLRERGARQVVLTGSDSPTLPARVVDDAFRSLEEGEVDVVIGPAGDGGYYLIGLREDQPTLFEGIDWSTERVLAQTLQMARAMGLRVHLLEPWRDVDDPADLVRLIEDLGARGDLGAPSTRAALQTLRRFGAPLPESPTPWQVLRSERRYESAWRNFDADLLTTHTGDEIDYTYFTTPDAVWVVPVTPDGEIVLIRQYRHPVRDWCLEVPAGSVIDGAIEATAARELREEIGGSAAELRFMGAFYSASAHLTLRGHVFLALDVELAESELEETELLVTVRVPARVAFDMARRGEVNEGESAMALLICERAILAHIER